MTQDELDQTLEQFKENFGDRPRYVIYMILYDMICIYMI